MRKRAVSIDEIKSDVAALVGQRLKISVNKGRKKIVRYDGELAGVYTSVYILKIIGDKNLNSLSS